MSIAIQIEYMTHASIYVRSKTGNLLTDPFFFLDPLLKSFMCHCPPRKFNKKDFGKIDYVYSSHAHDDHCHKQTLLTLKDQIGTYLLPAEKPDLEKKIRDYGFKKIILLENEKTISLKGGYEVTSFADRNGVDTALVIQKEGTTILHQNDCQLDKPTFERMALRFKIDYAFFPHTAFQDLYPMLLPYANERLQALCEEREKNELKYLFECLKILKPRHVIPYAYTIIYFSRDQWYRNGFGRTIPPIFRSKLKEWDSTLDCWVLNPGDVINSEKDSVKRGASDAPWRETLDDYLADIEIYTGKNRHLFPKPDFGEPSMVEKKMENFLKKRCRRDFPADFAQQTVALNIIGNKNKKSYFIDTEKGTFSDESEKMPFLEITIPALVLKELLSHAYDPFMILYSYRISFKLNIFLGMNPQTECVFYTLAVIALFDPDLHEHLMKYLEREFPGFLASQQIL